MYNRNSIVQLIGLIVLIQKLLALKKDEYPELRYDLISSEEEYEHRRGLEELKYDLSFSDEHRLKKKGKRPEKYEKDIDETGRRNLKPAAAKKLLNAMGMKGRKKMIRNFGRIGYN